MKVSKNHLQVTFLVELDAEEAQVLHLITSYDLVKWFREHCNKTENGMTPGEMTEVVKNFHLECNKCVNLYREAVALLNPKEKR